MRQPANRALGAWLAIWAAMLLVLILIGGATRLTGSGLSITEWKPVSGVLPPLDAGAWESEFARYRAIPQYEQLNAGMSLGAFKRIYLWEYAHRFWARVVGLAYVVPFAVFLLKRMVPATLKPRLVLLLVLLIFQAVLGWFMVMSGLSARVSVSQYRLAAHLSAALVIYSATVWIAADLLRPTTRMLDPALARWRRRALAVVAMTSITAVAGAFVAGLRAGHAYNTFPLMGGRLVPASYGRLSPWWRNIFENIPAVQFNHRVIATLTLLLIIIVWVRARGRPLPGQARWALTAVFAMGMVQFGLGIATLVLAVPVVLGVLHQGGAVLLLTAALLLLRSVWHVAPVTSDLSITRLWPTRPPGA